MIQVEVCEDNSGHIGGLTMQFFCDIGEDFVGAARHPCIDEDEFAVAKEITVADDVWDFVNAWDNLDSFTSMESRSPQSFIKMTNRLHCLAYIYIWNV